MKFEVIGLFCFHDDEMYFLDTIFPPPPLSKNYLLAQILGLRLMVGGGGLLEQTRYTLERKIN